MDACSTVGALFLKPLELYGVGTVPDLENRYFTNTTGYHRILSTSSFFLLTGLLSTAGFVQASRRLELRLAPLSGPSGSDLASPKLCLSHTNPSPRSSALAQQPLHYCKPAKMSLFPINPPAITEYRRCASRASRFAYLLGLSRHDIDCVFVHDLEQRIRQELDDTIP